MLLIDLGAGRLDRVSNGEWLVRRLPVPFYGVVRFGGVSK